MKHQQIQLASKRNFIRLMALAVMLVLMVCGTVLWISAANTDTVEFDLGGAGFTFNEDAGYWEKTYDGPAPEDPELEVTVRVNGEEVEVESALLNDYNASAQKEDGTFELTYITVVYGDNQTTKIPVRIKPVELGWTGNGTVEVEYSSSGKYTDKVVTLGALDLTNVVAGETVAIVDKDYKVSFNFAGCGSLAVFANVELTNSNYTVNPLPVDVTVNPVAIDSISWEGLKDSFVYGDASLLNVQAIGTNGGVPMNVSVKVGEEYLTLVEAFGENGLAVGTYELTVAPVSDCYVLADGVTIDKTIVVTKAVYNVVLEDGEFVSKGELTNPGASTGFGLVVKSADGSNLPDWILSAITYEYTDKDGNTVVKVTEPGTYTVKVKISKLDNAEIKIAKKTATMTVISNYQILPTPDGAIVIVGDGRGISADVEASVEVLKKVARPALRGLKAYKAYTVTINGAGDQVFSVRIPVSQDLIGKNLLPLTAADLYIYNAAAGTKEAANTKYNVTLSDDNLYYIIEGYVSAGEITLMIAPEYDTPFWGSAIGIALIVLLALVLIVAIPMFIGLMLIRVERSGRNPIISVETKGNVPELQPVVIPDKIEDPDAIVESGLNDKVDTLFAEVPAAEDKAIDVDATDAVADAMAQFNKELAEFDVAAYEAAQLAPAEALADELADQLARELMDQIPAATTDVSDEVEKAVADAMAENFNESADATDAIALITDEEVAEEEPAPEVVEETPVEEVVEETPVEEVVEEAPVEQAPAEETEENDDDDDDSFGGFGSMPLDYIDAIAEAERYAEMLEQESRGEVQLVTRYRRSYLSRLAQSQGSIQDYYNAIKNLLLSYKGVKSRISWNFESFNVGRTPLAKFNAKTRTLYVYIALSPEELVDTKYNFADMSEKKKYAAVPVLLKVKGERKFKHALELITKLCEEKLQLPKKKNFTEEDYRMPFKTTEELVNEGTIKMMVAAIPLTAPVVEEEAVVEEAPVEEIPVEEAVIEETSAEEEPVEEDLIGDVLFEETPVEEAPVEEAVIEEAPTEEAPVEEPAIEEAPAEEDLIEEEPVEIVLGSETAEETVEQNNENV